MSIKVAYYKVFDPTSLHKALKDKRLAPNFLPID